MTIEYCFERDKTKTNQWLGQHDNINNNNTGSDASAVIFQASYYTIQAITIQGER